MIYKIIKINFFNYYCAFYFFINFVIYERFNDLKIIHMLLCAYYKVTLLHLATLECYSIIYYVCNVVAVLVLATMLCSLQKDNQTGSEPWDMSKPKCK